jgi:DnaK suppressor protein
MATARKIIKRKATAKAVKARRTKLSLHKRTAARSSKTVSRKRTPAVNGKNGSEKKLKPLVNQKEMLQQERAQVEAELANLRAELQEAPEMTGDEVDLNVYEREKTLGLVATYERRLEEIEATLKVAEQGKYGICERCGNPIDPERLQIFPETRLCVSCKNQVEQEQRRLRM